MTTPKPLKILHLVGDHEDAGGVLSVIRNLKSVSEPAGWDHFVWVNERYRETRQPTLQYRYSRHVRAESIRHFDLIRQAPAATRELRLLCQEESFDVIHAHSRGTLLVAMLFSWQTKRPVVYTNHNYANRTGLYRWAARQSRMHSVVLTQNMARHYGLSLDAPRVHQISACYSDSFLEETLARRNGNGSRLRLVGVGSVIGWKKWDLIVEAIQLLPKSLQEKLECHIWGPTLQLPEAQQYDKQLRETIDGYGLGDVVQLRGSTNAVRSELQASDLFILPSTNEPCSVALMEALALGLPVIVSESGGCVDIVQPGCGLKFQPDTPSSLAAVLTQAIQERDQFAAPDAIRDTVRHRCASNVFEMYADLYQEIKQSDNGKADSRTR